MTVAGETAIAKSSMLGIAATITVIVKSVECDEGPLAASIGIG
jgi:hypothetical protein